MRAANYSAIAISLQCVGMLACMDFRKGEEILMKEKHSVQKNMLNVLDKVIHDINKS